MPFETRLVRVLDDPALAARRLWVLGRNYPPFNGTGPPVYKLLHLDTRSGLVTQCIHSRDCGMHSSGWFKNPDYERCWHLSLSFVYYSALNEEVRAEQFQPDAARSMVDLVYKTYAPGNCSWLPYIWEESAKSEFGKALGITHYRVFCNEVWEPIMPRAEVYSTELTGRGWKSWSDVHGQVPTFHTSLEYPDRG